jgi:hypothetical protein
MEIEKYRTQTDKDGRLVQLDCELNDDLLYEGYANELCANVMSARKEYKYALDDTLDLLLVTDNQTLVQVIEKYKDTIFDRVICNKIQIAHNGNRIVHTNGLKRSDVLMNRVININSDGKLTFEKFSKGLDKEK